MRLDEHDLHEFQTIYQQEFQEALSDDEARAMFTRLLVLYQLLTRPFPHEHASTLANSGHGAMLNGADHECPPN